MRHFAVYWMDKHKQQVIFKHRRCKVKRLDWYQRGGPLVLLIWRNDVNGRVFRFSDAGEVLLRASFSSYLPGNISYWYLGKRKNIFKNDLAGDIYVSSQEGIYIYPCAIQVASVQPNSRRDGFRGWIGVVITCEGRGVIGGWGWWWGWGWGWGWWGNRRRQGNGNSLVFPIWRKFG